MIVPKAIEIAVATVLREFAALPEGVVIRAWRTLNHDGTWDATQDRVLPLIDVRCTTPVTDDNQATQRVDCAILIGTALEDDRGHEIISAIEESVSGVLGRLFSQFRAQVDGNELSRFKALMSQNVTSGGFQFGGFTFGEGLAPHDDRGANMMGYTLAVHYGRADF